MLHEIVLFRAAWHSRALLVGIFLVQDSAGNDYYQANAFAATHWSVIVAAGKTQADPEIARAALAQRASSAIGCKFVDRVAAGHE